MAEYGYGYRSGFEKHTPLFRGVVSDAVPHLNNPGAKPNMANAEVNEFVQTGKLSAIVCKQNVTAQS